MKLSPLLFFLVCFNSAIAKNYYVSAKNGNAENSGLSPDKAKKQIQEAADLAKPGDTVFVMNGTYTSACPACNVLDIPKSGKKNKYIVYINYPGDHPVIEFDSWAGISINKGVSYVKVIGFEVIGANSKIKLAQALKQPGSCANKKGTVDAKYNGNGIAVDGRNNKHSHHIVIADNIIHDCSGAGIGVSQCDYITVARNFVYNTSWYTIFGTSGIDFYQFWNSDNAPGYHNIISGNKCYNNRSLVPGIKACQIDDGNGIIVDDFRNKQNGSKLGDYRNRTLIENNVCWYNGGTGIHTFQSDHIDIINNTAYCNSQSKELNPGQILSGLSNDNKIINNIMVADADKVINNNYLNTNLTYENNLHFSISNPEKAQINITSRSCLDNVNPLFVAASNNLKANFAIQKNSPAVGRGRSGLYSTQDVDGIKRAQDRNPDIGAYEAK